MTNGTSIYTPQDLTVEQVDRLIAYALHRGLDTDKKIVAPLRTEVEQLRSKAEVHPFLNNTIVEHYQDLVSMTQPVTGKTLEDSARMRNSFGALGIWTLLFLLLVIFDATTDVYFSNIVIPDEGWVYWLNIFQRDGLSVLIPFAWGALGSCVYLLKRLSDLVSAGVFDYDRFHGIQTRLLLGATLGGVAQFLFDPESFTSPGITLGANSLAFFIGIGVKAFYGGIEALINGIASNFHRPS